MSCVIRRAIHTLLIPLSLVVLSMLSIACGPPWPTCEKDQDCYASRSGNHTKRQLFCVVKQCRECRTVADCPASSLHKCKGYRCIRKTCADIVCPQPKRCNPKTLQCEWICQRDGETPCDGDPCRTCRQHQCIHRPPGCLNSEDCPGDQVCQQPHTCLAHCGPGCDPLKCTFPYECFRGKCLKLCDLPDVHIIPKDNSFDKAAHTTLDKLLPCLKTWQGKVLWIQAHDSDGKTMEYNIHRSLKRARVVQTYLSQKGLPASRTCLLGIGQEQTDVTSKLTKKKRQKQHRISFRLANQCP